jgi:hypothetical protein
MEFRLTYSGALKAHRDDKRLARTQHVHDIRQQFHSQLKELWATHPVLCGESITVLTGGPTNLPSMREVFKQDGFNWLPMVTEKNGLICKLDILMLRSGPPGKALYDVDNRLKTLFDALRMAKESQELGASKNQGQQIFPRLDEDPFYVLLEDDKLITHVAVTTDMLLQPVDNCPKDEAVRLVIDVTVRPFDVHLHNQGYV